MMNKNLKIFLVMKKCAAGQILIWKKKDKIYEKKCVYFLAESWWAVCLIDMICDFFYKSQLRIFSRQLMN